MGKLDRAIMASTLPWRIIRNNLERVSAKTGISCEDIQSDKKTRHIAHARQVVMYGARLAGVSFAEIGDFFGRDHTTVMHGVRAVEKRVQEMDLIA